MVHFKYSCHFWGKNFSPKLASKKTKLVFDESEEVGTIGKLGRYQDKPQPYGASAIRIPDNVKSEKKIEWLNKKVKPNLSVIRECGATDIYIDVAIYHDGQCNFEFDPAELKLLADLNLPFAISVYEDEKMVNSK
jgi:hypothetical protein